jgi:hypothetical protein
MRIKVGLVSSLVLMGINVNLIKVLMDYLYVLGDYGVPPIVARSGEIICGNSCFIQ